MEPMKQSTDGSSLHLSQKRSVFVYLAIIATLILGGQLMKLVYDVNQLQISMHKVKQVVLVLSESIKKLETTMNMVN